MPRSRPHEAGAAARLKFEIVDSRTLRDEDGHAHDVLAAMDRLPWVRQLCPAMPHEYAHRDKSDPLDFAIVERMLKASNPESYRAYFRGYQSPNRYWEAPDGRRYWLTMFMINRCWPDSVEPLRRVDQGAKAITDWDGPPYARNGIGLYERSPNGSWRPTTRALADGYAPCVACGGKKLALAPA